MKKADCNEYPNKYPCQLKENIIIKEEILEDIKIEEFEIDILNPTNGSRSDGEDKLDELPNDLYRIPNVADQNSGDSITINNDKLIRVDATRNGSSITATHLKIHEQGSVEGEAGSKIKYIEAYSREDRYKCLKCSRKFSRKDALDLHKRTHTGEKPYKCEICDKRFSTKSTLTTHTRIHTGEKPYKCEICDKRFRHSPHLKTHIRTHTGEKSCKCDICDKSFSQSFYLKIHMRIHTGEKPYKCEICDKSFPSSNALSTHTRVHTGEKPYKCEICSKNFSQLSNLKVHSRIHLGEKQ